MTPPDDSAIATTAVSPIDCATAVRRLWDYLDGRLPALRADEVESHLATCERCPPHFASARSLQRALAASPPPRDAADDARLRARVSAALRRHDGADDETLGET